MSGTWRHILAGKIIQPGCGPVWVANHYRAITDYVMLDRQKCEAPPTPMIAGARGINQWRDAEEQIEHFVEQYLKRRPNQLGLREAEAFDQWIPTVVFF